MSSVSCRPLWRSRTTLTHAADPAERAPRTGEQAVRLEQRLDVALETDGAAGEQDDVVADALDVGDHVRRDDDGRAGLGDAVHQQLEQLAAGERVEAREGLVQQHELRPLAEHERQREARTFALRERADLRARGDACQQIDGGRRCPSARSCAARTRSSRATVNER